MDPSNSHMIRSQGSAQVPTSPGVMAPVCPKCLRRKLAEQGSVAGSGPHATESFAAMIHKLAVEGHLL